ncbi:hypothetical protein FRB99_004067 [Tulasnella sp. 403]|nr:hypothetical protein FRB99_004067 [Tulasnella sp. 403]
MNAAISASVVLASRLSSNQAVFALVLFSVELFALFPILRRKIQAVAPPSVKITITALLGASATVPFAFVNVPVTVLITAILLFVNFACPAFFIWAQRYKKYELPVSEIKGPWDPAVPQVRKHKD